jgi:hypothetical protein
VIFWIHFHVTAPALGSAKMRHQETKYRAAQMEFNLTPHCKVSPLEN